jgi:PAS domain S-box-containing protein
MKKKFLPRKDLERECRKEKSRVRERVASAELSENESRLREIVDQVPGIVFQFVLKKNGGHAITYVCKRSRDLLGLRPEEIMENPEALLHLVSPEEQEGIGGAVLESSRTLHKFRRDQELDHAPCKWLRVEATPRHLADGATLWNGVALDITDRKTFEEEISRTRTFLDQVLGSIQEAVFVIGPPRRIVRYCNPGVKRLFGYEPQDLIGRTTERLHLDSKGYKRFAETSESALEKEGWFQTRYEMKRTDGKTLITEHTVTPICGGRGWQEGVVSVVRDVTERERAQEELRRVNKTLETRVKERTAELERRTRELQEFAFVASHDLKEPLRKIRLFAELLCSRKQDRMDEEGRDCLRRMGETANRMQSLLDALLSYARTTAHDREFADVDLNRAAKEAVADLEFAIQGDGAKVEIAPLPAVIGNAEQLRQLFQNLIANAVKFRRKEADPRVKIHATSHKEVYRILVEDNGIGFDEKYLEKIFQPFQRLHGKSEYPGTGIGLAICKKIVDRHGGTITARSAPGKGATFIVTLPRRQTKDRKAKGQGR